MDLGVRDRVAVITGASIGIGLAVTLYLKRTDPKLGSPRSYL
jgi:NADP-dependent 3-hydroxy acid dehydrogenase YdfG